MSNSTPVKCMYSIMDMSHKKSFNYFHAFNILSCIFENKTSLLYFATYMKGLRLRYKI